MELKEIKLNAGITSEGTIFIQDKDGGFSCGYGSLSRLYDLITTKIESTEIDGILNSVDPEMENERYEYKGVLLQRLNKDYLWYAIYKNQIVNWSQYRNDLESWINTNYKEITNGSE